MLRRNPSVSAASPTKMPSAMPANCTSDSMKPACSRLSPSASRSTGIAGGSLPTCIAALTPAATTIQAGSMQPRHAVAIACISAPVHRAAGNGWRPMHSSRRAAETAGLSLPVCLPVCLPGFS